MKLDDLLDKAFRHFSTYVSAADADAARYIHRTVRLHAGVPGAGLTPLREVSDPFVFLTGRGDDGRTYAFPDQDRAAAPYVALLVGSYGTGKTELAYRLCEFLAGRAAGEGTPRPLPVCLARCRPHRRQFDEANPAKFVDLLKAGLPPEFDDGRAWPEVAARVRSGEILLVLDGLDEFSQNETRYRNFLEALRLFLTGGGGAGGGGFRVVLTMRREYLTVVDTNDARWALRHLLGDPQGGPPAHRAYLMEINPYSDPEIVDYLARRLGHHAADLFDRVQASEALFATLRRPLLLKLFVDLVEDPVAGFDLGVLLRAIAEPRPGKGPPGKPPPGKGRPGRGRRAGPDPAGHGPGKLIDLYIRHFHDRGEAAQRGLRTTYHWDIDKLAARSVVLYRDGREAFEKADLLAVRSELAYPAGGPFPPPDRPDPGEDPFVSVHKCPFLIRTADQTRFAHRAFLEFLTAKGITDEVDPEDGARGAPAFNELVVNSDMRKFLQFFLGEEYFYVCIKESCGMNAPRGWGFAPGEYRSRRPTLDSTLRVLTEGMTYPETARPEVEEAIDWFLREAKDPTRFYPGYLVYCFHAIATYIQERPWDAGYREWRLKFDPILADGFAHARDRLRDDPGGDLNPWWERLIERVLYVGLRLRYPWAQDRARERATWLDGHWQPDTRLRVLRIIDKIEHVVF